MKADSLKEYAQAIERELRSERAGEHSYRPALKTLLESLASPEIQAINEPTRVACGAPDFIVQRGTVPLGYVEAKDIGEDLGRIEQSEQLERYRDSLANLILTDYIGFRWYLDGELRLTATLPLPGKDGRIRWNANSASEVVQLLSQFLAADIPLKSTPQDLATRMAGLARLLRNLIEQTFKAEGESGDLHAQLEAFRKVLIESLSVEQFADMYAQTLCYGLFAARCNAPAAGFTRQIAANTLPKTNPFLRKLFNSIAGPDLDERIAWAVDQLAELLARADMHAILADFGKRTRREDPVVHFYETFLAAYDPKMREARGVYYTPEPVVGYIVRSVDTLLRKDFGLRDGLANASKVRWKSIKVNTTHGKTKSSTRITETEPWVHRLQILDPATGTGTFLYTITRLIREQFNDNAGAWPSYVSEHLLPRLFGFELLMAPYAVAHMKLGLVLEQTGYDFASDQRLGVFLTNTLEEAHQMTRLPGFSSWLSEEANAASEVKKDAPVMVVLGNPPYSGHSSNKGRWIEDLMMDYKQSAELKKPAQAKWLSDDYVKFIRFAQWRIVQTGHGILGFVTNHGYLDNPTFMDMRRSLLRTFDEIYLLDLHGNSKKKEKAPDGGKDENVFDIQQGVAIGIFVRKLDGERDPEHRARVFHADLYGTRELKYATLDATEVGNTPWQEVNPAEPANLFVPQDAGLLAEYERGWSLRDVFALSGDPAPGIVTTHDEFAISWTPEEAAQKVERLLATSSEAEARELFTLCSQDQWRYARAKRELADGLWRDKIVPILYRPFDVRWTVYDRNVAVHRRERASDNMLQPKNLALCTARATEISRGWEHLWIADGLIQHHTVSIKEVNYLFPLWLYPRQPTDLLDAAPRGKSANLAPDFVAALTDTIGHEPMPEDTLAYIYAVLYGPSYRTRYADFLKRDFPRVPLTGNRTLFDALVEVGRELIALHTMQTTLPRITRYDVAGSNEVVKVRWAPAADDATGRVYINAEQYFDGVPQGVWETHIGGYRVAEKWLKDRKGRQLSYDDLTHYQCVIAALSRTLQLQAEIDSAIHNSGGWPLANCSGGKN